MKKILLALSLVAISAAAFAAPGDPGTGVLGSVHDMRTATGAGPNADITNFGGNDRVCAFCHTPHHAYQGADPNDYYPLWSRALDNESFTPYASTTINAIDWAADIAIGPTRLCMSCHDGTIAVDQHYGSPNAGTFLKENAIGLDWIGGAAIGNKFTGSLSNDHPLGFNYDTVAVGPSTPGVNPTPQQVQTAGAQEDPWIRAAADDLVYTNNTWGTKVADRLYIDPTDGSRYMTCATCHDVHNKKNMDSLTQTANYLVLAPQKDSALCLTCHIK